MNPLTQKRLDTVAVNQAIAALRAGCRPEQAIEALAVYAGLPLRRPLVARFPHPPLQDSLTADVLADLPVAYNPWAYNPWAPDPLPPSVLADLATTTAARAETRHRQERKGWRR